MKLYDAVKQARKNHRKKRRTNHVFGKSILSTYSEITPHFNCRSTLRGTTTNYVFTPKTYNNPWDAKKWRQWQGRAEEFWDARMQPRIMWEYEKNARRR